MKRYTGWFGYQRCDIFRFWNWRKTAPALWSRWWCSRTVWYINRKTRSHHFDSDNRKQRLRMANRARPNRMKPFCFMTTWKTRTHAILRSLQEQVRLPIGLWILIPAVHHCHPNLQTTLRHQREHKEKKDIRHYTLEKANDMVSQNTTPLTTQAFLTYYTVLVSYNKSYILFVDCMSSCLPLIKIFILRYWQKKTSKKSDQSIFMALA